MTQSEISRTRLAQLMSDCGSAVATEAVERLPTEVEHFPVHPASPPGWSHAMEVKFSIASERGSDVLGLSDLVYETAKWDEISIVLFEAGRRSFIVALDVDLERVIAVMRATILKPMP